MRMQMTMTPVANCDYERGKLIDAAKVQRASFDWEAEVQVQDAESGEVEFIKVKDVSVYEHRIILDDGEAYHIMHGLSS